MSNPNIASLLRYGSPIGFSSACVGIIGFHADTSGPPGKEKVKKLVFCGSRIIYDAWASTLRKLVSLGYCSTFVVSTGHSRREFDELAKLASASKESLQRANQTPVVVNNSGG
jgi:hypothetical protein